MNKNLKFIITFCLYFNFAFSMHPVDDLSSKLNQLKSNLVILKSKLELLKTALNSLTFSLITAENNNLVSAGLLQEPDLTQNIVPFYCDRYEIDPGDGISRTWSKLMSDFRDGGNFNNVDLFQTHSFIRWIFPVYFKGSSGYEHLDYDKKIVGIFKKNPILIDRLIEALKVFAGGYYKLNIDITKSHDGDCSKDIVKITLNESPLETMQRKLNLAQAMKPYPTCVKIDKSTDLANINFASYSTYWHNLKRIKRVLQSLMAFGLENYAKAFFACLEIINQDPSVKAANGYFDQWKYQVTNFPIKDFDKDGKYIGEEFG
jgi:hypothetical protein